MVSEIGLGTWQLGGGWGNMTDDAAMQTLRAAVDAGVTFLDTADVYGAGRSERFIGQFLKETRIPLFVATKLGRSGSPGWPANFSRAAVREHTEGSLKRLGVETLDLTQLHCVPTNVLEDGEIFDYLRELKTEGKIRDFGASVESDEQARICLRQPGLASLQVIFNIFRQKPITATFAEARNKNVAIIVRLPLASGLLAGKMTRETKFPANDHRNFNQNGAQFNVGETFAGLPFETGVELAAEIKHEMEAALPPETPMAHAALRWCLDFPEVTVIIPGAKSPEQARSNAAPSDLPPLPKRLHERLANLYVTRVAEHVRGPY